MEVKKRSSQAGRSLVWGIRGFPGGDSVSEEGRAGVPTYLVERYWPGVTLERLVDALRLDRQVMEHMSGEGTRVRAISCTLIPSEEVVFSVYEGPSAVAVRQLSERAGLPVSRIVEAIAVAEG